MTYQVRFANGDAPLVVQGAANVLPTLRCKYGYPVVYGHPGDLDEGGDRTLFWRDEQDAEDDCGHLALGEVRVTHRY